MANVTKLQKVQEWIVQNPTLRDAKDKERSDQKNALYVQLNSVAMMDLSLKDGQLCHFWKLEKPDVKYEGVACCKKQGVPSYSTAFLYDNFRKRCGLELKDKIGISATPGPPPDTEEICLLEIDISHELADHQKPVPELAKEDIPHWEWALKDSLGRAEHVFTGMKVEETLTRRKRRFKVESINGNSNAVARYNKLASPAIRIISQFEILMDKMPKETVTRRPQQPLEVTGITGIGSALEELNYNLKWFESGKTSKFPRPPQAILIEGPSGTGKTMIMQRIRDLGWGKTYQINERTKIKELRELFAEAKLQPSIILIDDLHLLVSKENSQTVTSGIEKELARELDKVAGYQVLCIAATSKASGIPKILTKRGIFNTNVMLQAPDANERVQIMRSIEPQESILSNEIIKSLGERTQSYVGEDLGLLLDQAGIFCRHRIKAEDIEESDDRCRILQEDVDKALHIVRPSAMRDVTLETPDVRWDDIGGQEEVKKTLRKVIEPQDLESQRRLGIVPPKGVLLYGPPGCSKTLTAQAMATEANQNFIAVKGAELLNMYVGESERKVREVFQKARAASPAIIFFDEIESIGSKREGRSNGVNVLTTLLNEMDGIEALRDVTVLAATNQPEALDLALLRPGRFDKLLYVAPPDLEGRSAMLRIQKKKREFAESVDMEYLAKITDGYSGAELVSICNEAASIAYDNKMESGVFRGISVEDFKKAISKTPRQISPEVVRKYKEWAGGMGVGRVEEMEESSGENAAKVHGKEGSTASGGQEAFELFWQNLEKLSVNDCERLS